MTYLQKTKNLLRSVLAIRRHQWANNILKTDSAFAKKEVPIIENACATLNSDTRAKAFIQKHETAIRFLIPANNVKRHNELRELIENSLN